MVVEEYATERLTVNIDDKFSKTLIELANGGSKADVIQRVVASYQYLKSEVPNEGLGKHVSITDATGKVLQNVILP